MDLRSYNKLIAASDEERTKIFSTVAAAKHENRVFNKMKIVNEVRDLKLRGLSKSAISRKTGLDPRTVSKYLDKNFDPVHASYGIKKGGILSAFYEDIDNLLKQGIMSSKIEEIIREKGFKGSSSTIRHYASEWKKRFKNEIKENEIKEGKKKTIMKRTDIFKTLFKPISDIKNFTEDKFTCFCEQYPFFKIILELVKSFKDIFAQNKPKLLKEWIEKARSTGIEEIISFTNGIERDYEAVVNAISLPYSNGLAEGCVNKIKVIKRVMYGRCSFETLRNKTIQLDKI
ncbi:transposase, partial [Hafnia paralvei]